MKTKEEILIENGFLISCHKKESDVINKLFIQPILKAMEDYADQFKQQPIPMEEKLVPHFWYMRDNHTFDSPVGNSLHQILDSLDAIAKSNPYGMVCPVILVNDKKEEKRIGVPVHVDKDGNWDKQTWYNSIKDNPSINEYFSSLRKS